MYSKQCTLNRVAKMIKRDQEKKSCLDLHGSTSLFLGARETPGLLRLIAFRGCFNTCHNPTPLFGSKLEPERLLVFLILAKPLQEVF